MKRTMLLASVILVFLLVTTRPSSAQMTKLPGTVPPNLGDIQGPSPAPPNMVLRMQLYFKFRNKELVDSILEGQSDPNSEYYGRSLSTKETDALFSPTKEDIDAVSTWLTSQGFELGALSEHAPVSLDFSGTADQVQRAFHISIIVSSDGRNRANTEDPLIPTQFQDIIQSIFGLSNLGGYSSGTLFNVPNKGPTLAFAPADLYEFYSISPLHKAGFKGAGGCIALVETSDFLDAAVTEFDGQFGISSVTVPRSVPAGQVNPGITSDEVEALIDVEWAHAVAPDAGLTVYLGNNTVDPLLSFPNAISLAATENTCNAIAVSFNVCQASANFFSQLDSSLALANMHSQSVFIQTGDFGGRGPGKCGPRDSQMFGGNCAKHQRNGRKPECHRSRRQPVYTQL
jgi:subtilase family serine protease